MPFWIADLRAEGDQFTEGFVLETLSWLLDNLHTLSITSPVSLTIRSIVSPRAITHIIDPLSSVITNLNLDLTGPKAIVSYLAEPFQVTIDGAIKLRWPLPKLTDLSFDWYDDLEPDLILGCIQRRAGRGLFWAGQSEGPEELPARLTRLRFPHRFSTAGLPEVFPDYMEWSGLDPEDVKDNEYHGRSRRRVMDTPDIYDKYLEILEEDN
ncbi:hypothetical protein FRB93_008535 [Tulasnella sp. JGI-2019a]|nr:hypothetical protein FRB93_008535 [Tulasnella sp. JGI-2019a]